MVCTDPPNLAYDDGLTERIIGLAIKVHRHFGPGLMESVYEA
jgi:PD-(D/E)XK nuclease superfamily